MLQPDIRPQLLLVEDDINLSYLLMENLHAKGYEVKHATTGTLGIKAINSRSYDLCLLDIMLPEEDGFSVASYLRKTQPELPFLFLTSRAQEADRLRGFELGADDYVLKPFCFKELHYRLQVILRRNGKHTLKPEETEEFFIGTTRLRLKERILVIQNNERRLSQREAELLHMLLQHQGQYVSRSEILKKLWGRDDYFTAKSMDVYLTRVRKLIKEDSSIEIENLYGSGYRIRLVKESS
jgi:DNA-binding response OmpR family regulator